LGTPFGSFQNPGSFVQLPFCVSLFFFFCCFPLSHLILFDSLFWLSGPAASDRVSCFYSFVPCCASDKLLLNLTVSKPFFGGCPCPMALLPYRTHSLPVPVLFRGRLFQFDCFSLFFCETPFLLYRSSLVPGFLFFLLFGLGFTLPPLVRLLPVLAFAASFYFI